MSLPATAAAGKSIQGKATSDLKGATTFPGYTEDTIISTLKRNQQAIDNDTESEEEQITNVIETPKADKEFLQCSNAEPFEKHETEVDTEMEIEPVETETEDIRLKTNEVETFVVEETEAKVAVENATTQTEAVKCKMIPIIKEFDTHAPSKVAVPRKNPPLSTPVLNERPIVLATHLVPSLPIGLFEILVEAIEVATEKPVVLLYEPRNDRPVAKGVTDIAILPASEDWEEGKLLPISFCFKHRLNKENSPCVYADVIVATDRASHVEDITDLRGHRCSLPDRRKQIGAAALLFNYLQMRGESPAFFGNTLDANTQVASLQMVAGKQAEVGILEAPVIKCHTNTLPGVESLHILTSLGPLPPYRIMVNKAFPDALVRKIIAYLQKVDQDKEWVDRFAPFGVTGFVENSTELYELFDDMKSVVTSVPYY